MLQLQREAQATRTDENAMIRGTAKVLLPIDRAAVLALLLTKLNAHPRPRSEVRRANKAHHSWYVAHGYQLANARRRTVDVSHVTA